MVLKVTRKYRKHAVPDLRMKCCQQYLKGNIYFEMRSFPNSLVCPNNSCLPHLGPCVVMQVSLWAQPDGGIWRSKLFRQTVEPCAISDSVFSRSAIIF